MIAYSIITFAAAAVFLVLGIALYKGNAKLIHDYHQTNITETDRPKYNKSLAIGLFALCATLLSSGMLALCGENPASLIVFFCGLIVSILIMIRVQKKYNGGLF